MNAYVRSASPPDLGNDLSLATAQSGASGFAQVGDSGATTTCAEVPWFNRVFPYQKALDLFRLASWVYPWLLKLWASADMGHSLLFQDF